MIRIAACAGDVDTKPVETAAPAAPIRTDRSSYVLTNGPRGPEATIVATLRAPADRTLYILNCNGASGLTLQRRTGEAWVWSWVVGMNVCMSPPIVVPPGGEHTAQIYLHDRAGARTARVGADHDRGAMTANAGKMPALPPSFPLSAEPHQLD